MIKIILSIAVSLMVAGSGVGLIAQQAKPGDMLYGFKTSINEKIAGLFVTEYTAQVDFEVSLLEERLEEIDELVKEGKLSAEDAVFAKAQVVAQLEKTQAAIAGASNQNLSAEQKARIAASLSRLQTALSTYKGSLTTLDTQVDAAVAAKPQLNPRGSRSKSIVAVITETADAIGQTAEEVLDTVVDIADEYVSDDETAETETEEGEETVASSTDDGTEQEVAEDDATSSEESTSSDEETTIEVDAEAEVETEAELEVDSSQL